MSDDTERLNWAHQARNYREVLEEVSPEYIPLIGNKDTGLLWAKGAPLYIAGSEGTGKTFLLLQYVRAAFSNEKWLGRFRVAPLERHERIVILNMDRPEPLKIRLGQIIETMALPPMPHRIQMLQMSDLQGKNLINDPTLLKDICRETESTHVLIDGLDRLLEDVTADQGGRAVADGMTHALSGGFQVMATMHLVKSRDNAPANNRSRDVYGSQYLGASAGSLLVLNKESETCITLKQRKNIVGHEPFDGRVIHDHPEHRSTYQSDLSVSEAMQELGQFTIQDLIDKTGKPRSTVNDHREKLSHLYEEIPQQGSGRIKQLYRWTGSPLTEQERPPLEAFNGTTNGVITELVNTLKVGGETY